MIFSLYEIDSYAILILFTEIAPCMMHSGSVLDVRAGRSPYGTVSRKQTPHDAKQFVDNIFFIEF